MADVLCRYVSGCVWTGDNPEELPDLPVVEVRQVPSRRFANRMEWRVVVRGTLVKPGDFVSDQGEVIPGMLIGYGDPGEKVNRDKLWFAERVEASVSKVAPPPEGALV